MSDTHRPAGFRVNTITNEAGFFLEPDHPKQRQYEALRAYFVEHCLAKDVAARFGYSLGAFLCTV